MLKSLFTYHQVEPSFLDFVYTFGGQESQMDLCLMNFQSSDTLSVRKDDLIRIPELGRSGREVCVSYLLRSVERDPQPSKRWKWNLRQSAVYHSFDFESGQSFWFTIKANDLF